MLLSTQALQNFWRPDDISSHASSGLRIPANYSGLQAMRRLAPNSLPGWKNPGVPNILGVPGTKEQRLGGNSDVIGGQK